MFLNYLKIAYRNLWKHKLFSFINIFGLALSISVCMMVIVQVKDDLSYDKFHPYPKKTYRIITDVSDKSNNKQFKLASSPLPLKKELNKFSHVIESSVQIYPAIKERALYGDKLLNIHGAFTDGSFFKVFGFRLQSGNESNAFNPANAIVLSAETSYKFFGDDNPLGKTLNFGKMGVFEVTGILEPLPGKTHIDFDAYISSSAIPVLEKQKILPEYQNSWNSFNNAYTYVLLKEDVQYDALQNSLKQINTKKELLSEDGKLQFTSQELLKITPGTDGIYNEIGKGTVWAKLLTVAGVGLLILVAACFNYTNLTIARALLRSKEVGIRKVNGASRFQIFLQYIIEAVVIAVLALLLAYLIFIQINEGKQPPVLVLIFFLFFAILTGIGAGAFPAWILSSFKPVNVFKNITTQKIFGNLTLQKGLTVFQFSLSLLILIFLTAYYSQFAFLKKLDPGFYSQNIITIPYSGSSDVFENEVSRISGVDQTYRMSENFGLRGSGSIPVYKQKTAPGNGIMTDYYFTDKASFTAHRLKIVSGTNFRENKEYVKEKHIILNEKAVKVLGFTNTASAINRFLWINDTTQVQIIGVVKDFYHVGTARRITPVVFRNKSDAFNFVNIVVNKEEKDLIAKRVEAVWAKVNPHEPFIYEWLDKKIAAREDQSGAYAIMGFLAFISVSIASLGLLGLVVYTVQTRQKEISVRKLIGANINQLMVLLSKGFLKLLVIAGLIAMPLGFILSWFFLQNFANRVPFGAGNLFGCFLFLLLIGLVTILSQTYKAAASNPVKNLRND